MKEEGRSSAVRALGCSTSGAAMAEYTVLLALLVAGGVAAYVVVATGADRVFRVTSLLVGSDSDPSQTLPADGTSRSSSAGAEGTPSQGLPGTHASIAQVAAALLGILVWIGAAAGGFLLWRILRRLYRRRAAASGRQPALAALPPGAQDQLIEKRQQIRRLISHNLDGSLGFEPQVRHLMSKRLVTVRPEMSSGQVDAVMQKSRIRHLLVCGKDRRLLGIISDRDLKQRTGRTAEDIMTPNPTSVSSEMAVGPAITILLSKSVSCLPVVDEGNVCGVLTTTDLLLSLQCTLQIVAGIATGVCCPDYLPEPLVGRP
ncbi:MAG: CBS domain-containing protein [Pirellulales bacterium]|nr:CBS domain-containing protein [Pirellulales bacterium]